jgi:hypothetical protein
VYKDDVFAAQCRRDQILRRLEPLADDLVRLYSLRQARVWAGGVGIAGFVALLAEVFTGLGLSTWVLLGSWGAMALAFVVALLVARRRIVLRAERHGTPSEDVFRDLSRLASGSSAQAATQEAHRIEVRSFLLPAVALTLLLPLTLHLIAGCALFAVAVVRFNAWILISLLLVGHAHITLIILAVMHVLRVRSELDRGAPVGGVSCGFWALLWTVTASTIPGALLLCIPPILVALTGLLFIPWMFHWISRRARAERQLLEDHGLITPLPRR